MPADALKCKECSTAYPLEARYVCERCFGPLEVSYRPPAADPAELRRRIQAGPHTLWRYADFLPLEGPARSALPTGWTPLVRADRLAERLGLREVWVKNETANPTHSFKDRVVSVALARARELGFETLACASTGNLANAVAAHAAAAGLPAYVLIPADLEQEKILATGAYGAHVVAVRGNYDGRGRSSTSTCAPTTRRAPRRSPTRPPSSSAGSCPTASSRRSPPARCSRRSRAASATSSTRGWSAASCPPSTALRPRAAPRWREPSRRGRTSAAP
jgi:Pyridoxal-phosphate dependent enzyme